jgi:hypothetical protein
MRYNEPALSAGERHWLLNRLIPALAAALALILAACAGSPATTPESPPDPLAITQETANKIRQANTFRLDVTQTGPDYAINTGYGSVLFRRASAQYVAPGTMQAAVRVNAAGIPIDVDVYADGSDQYYRAIWTGGQWLNETFSPGFDPQTLIAEDTGFQAALTAVLDLTYQGETTLENGVRVLHVSGTADGAAVSALLVGLIETQGTVGVDLFIDTETGYPARFMLTEAVDGEREPRIWTIDVYDINAPTELTPPEATAESTAAP